MFSQERLYEEVCSEIRPDDDVTVQDLNRMSYLDQVVKETLRWFVTVPFILRRTGKDIKLSKSSKMSTGYFIVFL